MSSQGETPSETPRLESDILVHNNHDNLQRNDEVRPL